MICKLVKSFCRGAMNREFRRDYDLIKIYCRYKNYNSEATMSLRLVHTLYLGCIHNLNTGSVEDVLNRLAKDPGYRKATAKAFKERAGILFKLADDLKFRRLVMAEYHNNVVTHLSREYNN